MSVVSERTTGTIRHEYYVPQPACWTDIQMALHLAKTARIEAGLTVAYDDVIKVTHDDDNIIVFWEEVAK